MSGPDIVANVDTSMDFSIDPCTNHYEFSCGQWLEDARIPSDKARFDKSWDSADTAALDDLRSLLEEKSNTTSRKRLHDYYTACMDEERIEELGNTPLKPLLAKIDAITNKEQLDDMISELCVAAIPNLA
eukprot:383335-Rhodomonas_salina.1